MTRVQSPETASRAGDAIMSIITVLVRWASGWRQECHPKAQGPNNLECSERQRRDPAIAGKERQLSAVSWHQQMYCGLLSLSPSLTSSLPPSSSPLSNYIPISFSSPNLKTSLKCEPERQMHFVVMFLPEDVAKSRPFHTKHIHKLTNTHPWIFSSACSNLWREPWKPVAVPRIASRWRKVITNHRGS